MSGTKRPTIYTASKTVHAPKWRKLRDDGHRIVSTWIDEAGVGETVDFADLARRCIDEPSSADVTILYCGHPGETLKGALIEAGAALAAGKHVVQVGQAANSESALGRHPKWHRADTVEDALRIASEICTPERRAAGRMREALGDLLAEIHYQFGDPDDDPDSDLAKAYVEAEAALAAARAEGGDPPAPQPSQALPPTVAGVGICNGVVHLFEDADDFRAYLRECTDTSGTGLWAGRGVVVHRKAQGGERG